MTDNSRTVQPQSDEVIAFEKERLAGGFRQRVRKTVTEVKSGLVSPLAVCTEGVANELDLASVDL